MRVLYGILGGKPGLGVRPLTPTVRYNYHASLNVCIDGMT